MTKDGYEAGVGEEEMIDAIESQLGDGEPETVPGSPLVANDDDLQLVLSNFNTQCTDAPCRTLISH